MDVPPTDLGLRRFSGVSRSNKGELPVIDRDAEGQCLRIVADDVRRPRGHIPARHHAEEVNQRICCCMPFADRVAVRASVLIAEQTRGRELVIDGRSLLWPSGKTVW